MKVLFLDFDGVLNNSKHQSSIKYGSSAVKIDIFDADCINQLKRILDATQCKVVISSSWRRFFDYDNLVDLFLRYDIHDTIIGTTPRLATYRGNEIQAWLDSNPGVEKFVILDDDADMVHLLPHLVQTNWDYGLTEKEADKAIEMLNGR